MISPSNCRNHSPACQGIHISFLTTSWCITSDMPSNTYVGNVRNTYKVTLYESSLSILVPITNLLMQKCNFHKFNVLEGLLSGKYIFKNVMWKLPKQLRKTENFQKPLVFFGLGCCLYMHFIHKSLSTCPLVLTSIRENFLPTHSALNFGVFLFVSLSDGASFTIWKWVK